MKYSFNLIDQPWVPCITLEGAFVDLSLRELLANAHQLRAIHCETPLMSAAMFPTVLALLHRVFGPQNMSAWHDLWSGGAFPMQPLEAYFDQWFDRFDLFHPEHPFYQQRDDRVEAKSILYLVEPIANAPTLFSHETEGATAPLTPAEAARHLLTAHMFRLGGGISGKQTPNFVDAHFTRGVMFTLAGSNLFQTLVLNLVRYPDENVMPHTENDKPIWEHDNSDSTRSLNNKILNLTPKGYLDYLTWQTNHVFLVPEIKGESTVVYYVSIAPVAKVDESVYSPQKRYIRTSADEPWRFLNFNTDKALWRDYHSLLMFNNEGIIPPAVVRWLAALKTTGFVDEEVSANLVASGRLANKAALIFYRQEIMPLPLEIVGDQEVVLLIAEAVRDAEEVSVALRISLNVLADQVLMRSGDSKPDTDTRRGLVEQWQIVPEYWVRLEPSFWEFVEILRQRATDALPRWHDTLKRLAHNSLSEAVAVCGTTAEALKGEVAARRTLNIGIKKLFESEGKAV